jgi:hypothetical protein
MESMAAPDLVQSHLLSDALVGCGPRRAGVQQGGGAQQQQPPPPPSLIPHPGGTVMDVIDELLGGGGSGCCWTEVGPESPLGDVPPAGGSVTNIGEKRRAHSPGSHLDDQDRLSYTSGLEGLRPSITADTTTPPPARKSSNNSIKGTDTVSNECDVIWNLGGNGFLKFEIVFNVKIFCYL